MIFKKGQSVTILILNLMFRQMKRAVNEITSIQINILTSGQILDILDEKGKQTVVTPMSSTNEQYFDTSFLGEYCVGLDLDAVRGGHSYLKYYLDEIAKINSME